MEKTLAKKSFPDWVKKLSAYDIHAPAEKDGVWTCEPAAALKEIGPGYPNTVQAPKKIVLPQRETLLEFATDDEGQPTVTERLPGKKPNLVFGVRPCDARALTLTDRVFGAGIKDPYYQGRRDRTVIVGLTCNTPPSSNCFCPTVGGSPHSTEGLDVLMTDLGDRYHVEALTDRGKKIVEAAKGIFKETTDKERGEKESIFKESEKKISRRVKGIEKIPGKLAGMFESPIWDREALSCIRCGICTYLCPACHCFDIADEVSSTSPVKGKRVRIWDTCQFPDFTMHSSGHNPRPDRASRLRQRVLHKFQYFVEHHQQYQCTGCGRCVSTCPVGIDIIDILDEVRDYE